MKPFFDSISLIAAARCLLLGVTAASLLIGCASSPDELPRNAVKRTAELRPRTATVDAVNRRQSEALRTCFDQGQQSAEVARGNRVEVELQLPASGVPSKVRVVNEDAVTPAVGRCLEEVIAQFNYGKSNHGATFYQVFIFDHTSDAVAFEKPVNAYQRWGLTREEIREVFAQNQTAINQCYALATEAPTGRIVLSISIRTEGPPERVALKSSTLQSDAADMCLVNAVLAMEFPQPRGEGITVREVPLHFKPDAGWINPKN